MRILLLNYEYPPLGGGAGNATKHILEEYTRIAPEVQVDVITSSVDTNRVEELSDAIRIHFLDIGKAGNIHVQSMRDIMRYGNRAFRYARMLMSEHSYDLVHVIQGIPAGYVAWRLELPYIVSLRGSDVPFYNARWNSLDRFFFQYASPAMWRRAAAVITNSEGLRELALEVAPHQEMGVIPNGVDIEEFKPRTRTDDVFRVISTSRLIERKGVHHVVEAWKQCIDTGRSGELVLIGSGNMEEALKERVAEAGIADSVVFMGALEHDQLAEHYARSDVFILASTHEGMSNSMLEAMASGCAIVSTEVGGATELLGEGAGMMVPHADPSAIAHAFTQLADNPAERERFQAKARQRAEQQSWTSVAQAYLDTYARISGPSVKSV